MSDITSLKFRMYNTGSVGDCLLLLFMKKKDIVFRMLIDCGGWNTTTAAVVPCVEDIRATCGGRLDLLVMSHQHEDHLSGFNLGRSVFDTMEIGEVWMSWVEDKTDEIGKLLRKKYGHKMNALRSAVDRSLQQLRAAGQRSSEVKGFGARMQARRENMEATSALLRFEEGRMHARGLPAGKRSNEDAINWMRQKARRIKYRRPGEVIDDLPGIEGIKFFILGPPRDADMKFFRIAMRDEEMYHLALAAREDENNSSTEDEPIVQSGITLEEGVSPFGLRYQMQRDEARAFQKMYKSKEYRWRQIEEDWLESASAIALRVTSLTNNTSLAIAIELDKDQVMLLPADAQSGNWMSWHKPEVMKALKKNGGKDTIDLLKNTVFYKVGHHGSHNGTASLSGLDLVPDKKLVAMMPLVQKKVPPEWGGAKNFPAKALYKVLISKTKGRVIRTDEGIIKDKRAVALRSALSKPEQEAFNRAVTTTKQYVEYTIKI